MNKLKILCLQGYRQNEVTFRERSGAFRKLVKKYVDFTFISAPHVIPEEANLSRSENEQERGWWFSRPEKAYNALDKTEHCIGFEESFKLIEDTFESKGPFDGFKSLVAPHATLYDGLIDCPSFHTIGSTDAVIPSQSSEELLSAFVEPVVYRHEGGHYVPASPQLRTAVTEFLAPFLTK